MSEHLIDCDADPIVCSGFTVAMHQKDGQFAFTPEGVRLHLVEGQSEDGGVEWDKIGRELSHQPVLNANVLDYLLTHPEISPDEWKQDDNGAVRCVLFWGTIYRHSGGTQCVRLLMWDDDQWHCLYVPLEGKFGIKHPAALRVT
jgi:hypothetical protein